MDKSAKTPEELGNLLLTRLGQGAVGGLGVTALYHMLDQARRKKKPMNDQTAAISAGAPVIAKVAASGQDALIGGLLGAAGGGLYGGLSGAFDQTADKSKRMRNALQQALLGAAGGGALGAGVGYNKQELATALGNMVPTTLVPGTGGDTANVPGDYATGRQKGWHTAMGLGALGLGTAGGSALVNNLMKKKKTTENTAEIDSARDAYLAALRGDDVKAAAALDSAFAAYQEKKSSGYDDITKMLGSAGEYLTAPGGARGDIATAMLLSTLGGGIVGGHYMYNKTKQNSQAENLRKAMQSRARMQGLPPMWIDPEELAQTKQIALSPKDTPRLEHDPGVSSAHG